MQPQVRTAAAEGARVKTSVWRGLVAVALLLTITGAVFMAAGAAFVRLHQGPANWTEREYRNAGFDVLPDRTIPVTLGRNPMVVPMDPLAALQQRGGPGEVSEIEFHFRMPRLEPVMVGQEEVPPEERLRLRLWAKHSPHSVADMQGRLMANTVEAEWLDGLRLNTRTSDNMDRFVPDSHDAVTRIDCGRLYEAQDTRPGQTPSPAGIECTSITYIGEVMQAEMTFDRAYLPGWQDLHRRVLDRVALWRQDGETFRQQPR